MCSKRQRMLWKLLRLLVFLSAASLVVYIPFKYATQSHALVGVYGMLFPFSGLVAASGLLLAVRPDLVWHLPGWLRTGIAAISMGWIAAGMLCTASLTRMVMASPAQGLFATFQMTAQHLFLSTAVIFGLVATQWVYSLFDLPLPDSAVGSSAAKRAPGAES